MIMRKFGGLALGVALGIIAAAAPAVARETAETASERYTVPAVESTIVKRLPLPRARFAGTGSGAGNSILLLIFQATAWANIADNAATTPNTALFWSAHTASPAGSSQTTSEAAATSYARVSVARTSGGFTVSSLTVALAATLSFPTITGGSETWTHFGIGKASTSTGSLFFYGTITPNLAVSNGSTGQITTATFLTLS
jgi:hypothetical protein